MIKKIWCVIISVIAVCSLCACGVQGADDCEVAFPSVYMNTMEEDFSIDYTAGKGFGKNPEAVVLSGVDGEVEADIYSVDDAEGTRSIECGVAFDTEDGVPAEDVNFNKCLGE